MISPAGGESARRLGREKVAVKITLGSAPGGFPSIGVPNWIGMTVGVGYAYPDLRELESSGGMSDGLGLL